MAILENRVKINSRTADFFKLLHLIMRRCLIVLFVVFSIYLLYFAKPKKLSNFSLEAVGGSLSVGLSFYEEIFSNMLFLFEKLNHFNDINSENLKFKLQLANFTNLENEIEVLKKENQALRTLLNVIPDEKYDCITARLLSLSLSPFSKTILIAAGSKNGVEENQIVTNEQGLIGRITQVSDNYSRVMLINDFNSRVPVVTLLTHERGILTGNNSITQMNYLQKNHRVQKGEKVVTSGDGIIYPKGIVVGKVSKSAESEIIIEPVNFNQSEFVNILKPNYTPDEIKKIN